MKHKPDRAKLAPPTNVRKAGSDRLMSVGDVADFLRVGRSMIYTLPIPIVRIGRRRLYHRADVLEFAAARRIAPTLPGDAL